MARPSQQRPGTGNGSGPFCFGARNSTTKRRNTHETPSTGQHQQRKSKARACVPNISTTPGKCCDKGVPCLRQGCYALKALRLYPATRAAWRRNEYLARNHPDSYFKQIATQVTAAKPRLFRWHVAGDILSSDYLTRDVPDCRCQSTHTFPWPSPRTSMSSIDTKIVRRCRANLVIVFSAWPGMSFLNPHRHRVAWMQDGTETRVPEDAIECPGNCESCGMCYELDRLGHDVVFHKH